MPPPAIDVLIGVPADRRERVRSLPRYRPLVAALARDFAEVHDEAAAAEICRMRHSTFKRRFLEDAGVSFAHVRAELQFAISADALSAGERVKRAAILAHYSSPEVLARAFRRKTGLSPSEFRKREAERQGRPGG